LDATMPEKSPPKRRENAVDIDRIVAAARSPRK
jgi:hypothetical protein